MRPCREQALIPGQESRITQITDPLNHVTTIMSFAEIGTALGISTHCAEVHYRNGMKKLRQKHPRALQWLRILAEERSVLMQERLKGAGGPGVEN
ncbi:MAG TPA: hypothetical protein VK473_14630 [Terriglobales bacterium]|nr:hypothetical protein [Terriglobales bacterium]